MIKSNSHSEKPIFAPQNSQLETRSRNGKVTNVSQSKDGLPQMVYLINFLGVHVTVNRDKCDKHAVPVLMSHLHPTILGKCTHQRKGIQATGFMQRVTSCMEL